MIEMKFPISEQYKPCLRELEEAVQNFDNNLEAAIAISKAISLKRLADVICGTDGLEDIASYFIETFFKAYKDYQNHIDF